MVAKTDAKPALFSTQWWEFRRAVMADIGESQARLRKAHALAGDADPALQRLLSERSEAATALALYGASSPAGADCHLEHAWQKACDRLEQYQSQRARAA